MTAVFLWLLLGMAIGLVVGAAGTWFIMRRPLPEPVRMPAPVVEIEPPVEEEKDMGRTAGEMLADLERKFGAMRRAEAEQAAKPKRKSPAPRAKKTKP